MTYDDQRHARSFGGVADAYDRGRPGYPDDAVAWLLGDPAPDPEHPESIGDPAEPRTVLELGAGTGKLTERMLAHGHDVLATEPDAAMLEVLRGHFPDVPTAQADAEAIPVPDRSIDVVVGAQCYHWFDPERALPEIARVLRPGGYLALVWHARDERIPWVRKLGRIIGNQDHLDDAAASLTASELFEDVETETFTYWQSIDRRSVQDLAVSRSVLAVMNEAERARVIEELLALYDDYGRGMDGMQLPYRTLCFRARVAERPDPEPEPESAAADADAAADGAGEAGDAAGSRRAGAPAETVPLARSPRPDRLTDSATTLPRILDQRLDDGSLLLIDFH